VKILKMATLAVMLMVLPTAPASALPYFASRDVGTGHVTLNIFTDGKIGKLSAANVLDWTVTISNLGEVAVLTGPASGNGNSIFTTNGGFSATPDHLFFDFDDPEHFVRIGSEIPGEGVYALTSSLLFGGPKEVLNPALSGSLNTAELRSDFFVVASVPVAPPLPIPEPASPALMMTGLGLVWAARKLTRGQLKRRQTLMALG
jgi:hypothetical protein